MIDLIAIHAIHIIRKYVEWFSVLILPAVLFHIASRYAAKPFFKATFNRLKMALYLLSITGILCIFIDPLLDNFINSQNVGCVENMRALNLAIVNYADDWDETLPPASRWYADAQTRLSPDMKGRVIRCTASLSPFTYALNGAVGGASMYTTEVNTVMLFECDATSPNAFGNKGMVSPEKRHWRGLNFVFLSGNIKSASNRTEWDDWKW